MNTEVLEFYSKSLTENPIHPFFETLFLEEGMQYSVLKKVCPLLPKGWIELSTLELDDRKELIKEFWQQRLLYFSVDPFFQQVKDIGVFLVKKSPDTEFLPELVYSFAEGKGFIRAEPGLEEKQVQKLMIDFDYLLPRSYLDFLQIHRRIHDKKGNLLDPFTIDNTSRILQNTYQDKKIVFREKEIEIGDFIPFYQKNSPKGYQCFISSWSVNGEIGNVFFSEEGLLEEHKIKISFLCWLESLLID